MPMIEEEWKQRFCAPENLAAVIEQEQMSGWCFSDAWVCNTSHRPTAAYPRLSGDCMLVLFFKWEAQEDENPVYYRTVGEMTDGRSL